MLSRQQARAAVCIPLYNKAEYVAQTVESALGQTFPDLEVIVLDNASTDGSDRVVESYTVDPRVSVYRNESTIPPGPNFRRAVELSSAPLVKILCADDVLVPTCIEHQVKVLDEHPSVVLTAGRQDFLDDHGDVVVAGRGLASRRLLGRQSGAATLRLVARHGGNPIGANGSGLFRRSAFDAAVAPTSRAFHTDDIEMWTAMLTRGDFYGTARSVAGFRFPDGVHHAVLGVSWLWEQWQLAFSLRRLEPTVRRRDVMLGCGRVLGSMLRHDARALRGRRLRPRRAGIG